MPYVISKLAAGMNYTSYRNTSNGSIVAVGVVNIKGGANVADPKTLVTPEGVVTHVTDSQLEALNANPSFKAHLANGVVKVMRDEPKNPDVAASDLEKDASAQITEADYVAAGANTPTAGSKKGTKGRKGK